MILSLGGCVSVNTNYLLPTGTTIGVIDVSSEIKSTDNYVKVTIDSEKMRQRLMTLIIEGLQKNNIAVAAISTPGSAKLKYKIRYVDVKKKGYEIGFNATLETPYGKILFSDDDEKDGDEIENILEDIAKRVVNVSAGCFKITY